MITDREWILMGLLLVSIGMNWPVYAAAYRNARKSFNDVLIAALPEVSMHEVLEARRAQKDAESRAEAAEKRAETAEQQLAQFHSLVRKAG